MAISVNLHRRIPVAVMRGDYELYESVPRIFLNRLVIGFLEQVYNSYTARSVLGTNPNMNPPSSYKPETGEQDDDGNQWEQLKPKTYRMKRKLKSGGKLPATLEARLADYGKNPGAQSVLDRYVIYGNYDGDNINIRTGELLASFYPPVEIDGHLIEGPDQEINVSGIGAGNPTIEFSTTLDEKEATCEKFGRPIIPSDEQEQAWIERAIPPALEAAELEFDRLLVRYGHTRGGKKTKKPSAEQLSLDLDVTPQEPKSKEKRLRGPKRYRGPSPGQTNFDFGDF